MGIISLLLLFCRSANHIEAHKIGQGGDNFRGMRRKAFIWVARSMPSPQVLWGPLAVDEEKVRVKLTTKN